VRTHEEILLDVADFYDFLELNRQSVLDALAGHPDLRRQLERHTKGAGNIRRDLIEMTSELDNACVNCPFGGDCG
jgi:hypothetical protein